MDMGAVVKRLAVANRRDQAHDKILIRMKYLWLVPGCQVVLCTPLATSTYVGRVEGTHVGRVRAPV